VTELASQSARKAIGEHLMWGRSKIRGHWPNLITNQRRDQRGSF
jgi:hypothetical protein